MKPASLSTVGSMLSHHMTLSKLLPFISVMHFNLQGLFASLTPPLRAELPPWPRLSVLNCFLDPASGSSWLTLHCRKNNNMSLLCFHYYYHFSYFSHFSRSLSGRRHRWHSALPLHRCLRSIIDDLWSGRTPHWVLTVSSVLTQRVTLVVYGFETVRSRSLGVSRSFIGFCEDIN